jgi:hypothetical protein
MEKTSFVDWFYKNCNKGEDITFARKVWDASHESATDEEKEKIDLLTRACEASRAYLEQRGMRTKGTVGKTIVLPLLDEALDKAGSSLEAGTVII